MTNLQRNAGKGTNFACTCPSSNASICHMRCLKISTQNIEMLQAAASRARAAQAERKATQEGPDSIPSKRQLSGLPTGQSRNPPSLPSPPADQQAATPDALRQDPRSAAAEGRESKPETENFAETPSRPVKEERMRGNPFREEGYESLYVHEPPLQGISV